MNDFKNTKLKILDLSPLRYPGSKKNLFLHIKDILKYNDVKPDLLIEPFSGGASISLHFIFYGLINKAIISDKDKLVSSFWQILFNDPNYLIKFIKHVKVNLNNFYKYKEIARFSENYSIEVLAEACIFLNRTSFSGLLTDNVGPLGGKKQNSIYKIDCRFIRDTLIKRIQKLKSLSNSFIVLDYDWKDTIKYAIEYSNSNSNFNNLLFYFDPPFFNKAEDLYRSYFNKQDHIIFHNKIMRLKQNWILSYDNASELKQMYSGNYRKVNIEMLYSINSNAHRKVRELIITPLKLPIW